MTEEEIEKLKAENEELKRKNEWFRCAHLLAAQEEIWLRPEKGSAFFLSMVGEVDGGVCSVGRMQRHVRLCLWRCREGVLRGCSGASSYCRERRMAWPHALGSEASRKDRTGFF